MNKEHKFELLTAVAQELNALDKTNSYAVVYGVSSENPQIQIGANPECYLWFRSDKNRFDVSGNFHLKAAKGHAEYFGNDRGEGYAGITVSAEKAPAKIAQDVLRRIVPQYLAAFKIASDARDNRLRYRSNCIDIAQAITEAAGEVFTDDTRARLADSQELSVYINRREENSLRLGVRVSDGTAEIGIGYLSKDKCVRLVEFLKTLIAE